MQKAPMSEEMRSGSDDPRQPISGAFGPLAQPLELVAGPADQECIDTMQCRGQFRLVEVTVVVDPALDVRSEHPRQILQGFVGPMPNPNGTAVAMSLPSCQRLVPRR